MAKPCFLVVWNAALAGIIGVRRSKFKSFNFTYNFHESL